MAFGFSKNKSGAAVSDAPPPLPNASLDTTEKSVVDGDAYDPESLETPRKLSRVDKYSDSDSSSGLSVGKQMEMEAENAIKYRTCSWPKV